MRTRVGSTSTIGSRI